MSSMDAGSNDSTTMLCYMCFVTARAVWCIHVSICMSGVRFCNFVSMYPYVHTDIYIMHTHAYITHIRKKGYDMCQYSPTARFSAHLRFLWPTCRVLSR